uniref:Putative adp-ribosylation factor gtpase-activating protein agd4-like isoform x3 n=1 Tax=Lupinus angustifolius TaxID=3871 RepID=A0A182BFD7_LUPAN|nr:putative adp-ribosylation factor gtpase-activating protein agd4-like isoform x3 [Lupinus angustifolius]
MASSFVKLDDSPMFQKQLFSLEETTGELKDRCQKLFKGCKKFMTALGEEYNGEISFADSLEAFGGGQDDPVSVSIGGPVISKFITTLRELASFKELLRSQVEHVLIDRLTEFMTVDLQDAKDSRRRFDKAVNSYDQSREKFVSLKKNTPGDVVAELEEVHSLMNIEVKKKYEFLESVSAIMDAHLRYFKLGYELLSQMEPYIHQVLTYAQQSKEMANIEQDKLAKRIQEYRTQAELENIRASSNTEPLPNADSTHVVGLNSYKSYEAGKQPETKGEAIMVYFLLADLIHWLYQAENEADRMDWPHYGRLHFENKNSAGGASLTSQSEDSNRSLMDDIYSKEVVSVSKILRGIPGNDKCAECSAPEPEWASLNLGILLCIECSGVHRNLGVHISKVRSITLDVKVWEPAVLELFDNLGNAYCNSIWEGLLLLNDERVVESNAPMKPCSTDAFQYKEKYIQAKYVEKSLIIREEDIPGNTSLSIRIWQAVQAINVKEVYRLIVTSNSNLINMTYDDVVHHVDGEDLNLGSINEHQHDPEACLRVKDTNETERCFLGWSLLHLACHSGSPLMVELLLQFGADVNMCDYHGRTPLHHCISTGKNPLAKFLLRRGAKPSVKDAGGLTVLERAMEMGAISDEELFIKLAECQ